MPAMQARMGTQTVEGSKKLSPQITATWEVELLPLGDLTQIIKKSKKES
jgi:hypothetical protein